MNWPKLEESYLYKRAEELLQPGAAAPVLRNRDLLKHVTTEEEVATRIQVAAVEAAVAEAAVVAAVVVVVAATRASMVLRSKLRLVPRLSPVNSRSIVLSPELPKRIRMRKLSLPPPTRTDWSPR